MLETQFSCKISESFTTVVGSVARPYYFGNPLLTENLSQQFDYCEAVVRFVPLVSAQQMDAY